MAGDSKHEEKAGSAALAWLLASASVSGLLVAVGFLLDVASQGFLGYELRESAGVEFYSARGGQFAISAVAEILTWAQHHAVVAVGSLLAALFVGGAMRSLRGQRGSVTRATTLLLAAAITVYQLVHYDFPALRVQDVLVRNVELDPAASEPGVARANALYTMHVCARIAEELRPAARTKNIVCTGKPERYRQMLGEWFTNDLMLTVLASVLVAISLLARMPARARENDLSPRLVDSAGHAQVVGGSPPTGGKSTRHLHDALLHAIPAAKVPSLVLVTALLLAHAMGLVVTYARTSPYTESNDVTAWFTTREILPGNKCGQSAPARSDSTPPDSSEREVYVMGVLLSQASSQGLALYNYGDDNIWMIPADHLITTQFNRQKDALALHFTCDLASR